MLEIVVLEQQSSPEVAQLFGETVEGDNVFAIPAGRDMGGTHRRPATSFHPRRTLGSTIETPRAFDEDVLFDNSTLIELEEVKRERSLLMSTIAQFKKSSGSAGGEAQDIDIRQLMKELELKKQKLNELRQEARMKEKALSQSLTLSSDCEKLMRSDQESLQEYIHHLNREMNTVKDDLVEVEAKNRLYALLGERTRQEHMASEQKVRESREMRKACRDDVCSLSRVYHEACSLKEDSEKQLNRLKRMTREVQTDWQRKLKDRRKEVRRIRRRQLREKEREARRAKKKHEKEQTEMELEDKRETEKRAMEQKTKSLIPQIQSLEATWHRLCSVSGADTVDGIISFWQGLNTKGTAMKELVNVKEKQEAEGKEKLQALEIKQATQLEGSDDFKTSSSPCAGGSSSQMDEMSNAKFARDQENVEPRPNALKEDNKSEAVGVRTEQSLSQILCKLRSLEGSTPCSPTEYSEQELALPVALKSLFKETVILIQTLQGKRKAASSQDHSAETTEESNDGQGTKQAKFRGLSFKSTKAKIKKTPSADVSKLVGFIDDQTEECPELVVEDEDEDSTDDEVVKRSFIKARSQRFLMRSLKTKDS